VIPVGTTVFERSAPSASVVDHSLDQTREGVFWIDDLPAALRPDRPPLRGTVRADLVVVGAGYTGLWTALLAKLRDPHRRVVIVEAQRVGWAASGRNGGFCEASLTHGHENGASRWPKEIDTLERLGRQNLDEIERTVADLGLDVQFERTGELAPAIEEHQLAWLDDWRAEAADDPDVVYLDEEAVRASVNSPTYLAAIWEKRSSALVHPARLAAELARACEERGVEIFERSHVTSLDSSSAGVTVITSGGWVRAAQAVLATNVFPSLLARNKLMTVPVYDYALMTEPLTRSSGMPSGGAIARASATWRTSSTTTGRRRTGGSSSEATTRCTTTGAASTRGTSTAPTCGESSPPTSSRRSRSWRGCASRTSGRERSIRRPSSQRSSARRAVAAWPMPPASRGSEWGRRGSRAR
jgi:glycine/D-amino acid oxidase-like deaminating enzyme